MDTTKSLGTLVWYTFQSRAVSINLDLDVLKAAVACFFIAKMLQEKKKSVYIEYKGRLDMETKQKQSCFYKKDI